MRLIVSVSASSHMPFNKAFIKWFHSLKAGYKWNAGELFLWSREIKRKLSLPCFIVRTFQSEIILHAAIMSSATKLNGRDRARPWMYSVPQVSKQSKMLLFEIHPTVMYLWFMVIYTENVKLWWKPHDESGTEENKHNRRQSSNRYNDVF